MAAGRKQKTFFPPGSLLSREIFVSRIRRAAVREIYFEGDDFEIFRNGPSRRSSWM